MILILTEIEIKLSSMPYRDLLMTSLKFDKSNTQRGTSDKAIHLWRERYNASSFFISLSVHCIFLLVIQAQFIYSTPKSTQQRTALFFVSIGSQSHQYDQDQEQSTESEPRVRYSGDEYGQQQLPQNATRTICHQQQRQDNR